jgi:hypothetical protein
MREADKQRRKNGRRPSFRSGETPDEWLWRQPWKIKLPIMVGLFVLIVVLLETGLWVPLGFIVLLLWFVVALLS